MLRLTTRVLAAALLVMPAVAVAQTTPDTVGVKQSSQPLFTNHDAWIAGGFVLGTIVLFPLDRTIAQHLQDHGNQANRFFHHQATNFRLIAQPGALIIGGTMYAVGRVAHVQRLADLGLHGTEAIGVGIAVTGLIKGAAGRARPYMGTDKPHDFAFARGFRKGSDYESFPSGHTLTGFAAAAAVTAETHRWWPHSTWYIAPVMYGGATLIGMSRMYNNKHWASDVMMGAAIGTFAGTKVVRYHHSHSHNRIDRWLLNASIAPTDHGWGVAFSAAPR